MKKLNMTKTTAALLAGFLALGGCATGGGPGSTGSSSANFECNPAMVAGIGAIVGGLIAGGNNTLSGAAIGGALGALACMTINYHSEQVKSAQQVQDEYKVAHHGLLPKQSTVTKFETHFKPAAVQPGTKTELNSYVEVAASRNDPNPKVDQEMSLYTSEGKLVKSIRKPVSETGHAGAFRANFQVAMPEGSPQGVYPVKTALYVNGTKVRTSNAKLQVVMKDGLMTGKLVAMQ